MKVDRDVLLDLLPLYVSGEARKGTATLIEQQLHIDPELKQLAEQMRTVRLPELPPRVSASSEFAAFARTKHLLLQRTAFLTLAIAFTVMLAVSMGFLLDTYPHAGAISFVLAVIFWVASWVNGRRLSRL